MNTKSSMLKLGFSMLLFMAMLVGLAMPTQTAKAVYATYDNPDYYYAAITNAPSGTFYRQAGFSPDDTQILAQKSWNDGTYDRTEIILMNADGSGETIISPGDSGVGDIYGYMNPFWSDDGTAIGFAEVHNTTSNKIMRYDIVGGTTTYIYEPAAGLDASNPDFLGASKTVIVFWDSSSGSADLFTWDGTTLTNITNTTDYKEYEPVSNADGTMILYWSGETTAEPVNTTHTLTYSSGTWTKDVGFTPIADSYWAYWTTPAATQIALTVMSSKDILIYDSTGVFVTDLSGTGYSGGGGQWNFFGSMPQGPNSEFVVTSNAGRGATPGRDILIAAPRTTLYVDDTGSDSNPGTAAAPFATIQKGVNEVAAGGTVNVAAGTYREQVVLNKALTLAGDRGDVLVAGPGPNAPILDGDLDNNGTPDMGDGFTIPNNTNLSGITIEGFIIRNFGNGGGGNGVGVGVISWENTSSNVTIRDNRFTNLGYDGIYVGTDSDDMQSNWLVQYNIVEGAPYAGIELTDVTNSQVLYNEITAPTAIFDDPGDAGVGIEIAARARTGPVTTTNVLVKGNTINGAFASGSRAGINLLSRAYIAGSTAILSHITVEDNTISGSSTRGIYLVAESRNGGSSQIANLAITANTLNGNTSGIEVGGSFAPPKANGTYDFATFTIDDNQLAGNTAFGLNNLIGAIVTAENNWWGSASGPGTVGPGSGDMVSANVDYSPWCTDAACATFAPPFATTTTITADTPDPSLLSQTVSVTATVAGLPAGAPTPTGTVTISGGVTDCTITLVSGTGSCDITFNTGGAKTITATYNPDSADFITSSDTEGHTIKFQSTFTSQGAYDGWVLESGENTNLGGALLANWATFNLGDYNGDRQFRAILSFNTASLPDTAVITKVTLKIKKQGLVGTNPFTILGGLKVDMRKPFFGTAVGLAIGDFQAAVGKPAVATFGATPVSNWYSALLNATGRAYVNKTGTTQFRLRFATDDNNNNIADYMKFFSGDYATASVRPTLIIEYYVP